MVSYSNQDPMADYLTKLLVLEAARCAATLDQEGLEWVQDTMLYLASRWEELRLK